MPHRCPDKVHYWRDIIARFGLWRGAVREFCHDEAGQVLIFRAQAVDDPGSHGGARKSLIADAPENNAWDHHGGLREKLPSRCAAVDQPIAALLTDLKARGLLDDTLVLWGGEFGRTPTAEGNNGREHHPFGFTMWLAGGGIKGGMTYGATDEFGWHAVENKVHVHDLHATILHLLGLDHQRLTFRYGGRDQSLTDIHGRVVREIV